jgi:rhodanese-related sulfurtransferase
MSSEAVSLLRAQGIQAVQLRDGIAEWNKEAAMI